MKKTVFIFLLFISFLANSQDYKKDLSGIKTVKIYANTSLTIKTSSENSLFLSTDEKKKRNHNSEKKMKKREGLTAIYSNGTDDTNGLGFSIKKEGNILIIKDLKALYKRSKISIALPKDINLIAECVNIGNLSIEGFNGEIEAQTNTGNIKLTDITGPLTVNSATGHINVIFNKVSQQSPTSIQVASGEIDVTLPANTNANLDIDARGTFYTNFDIKPEKKKGLDYVGGGAEIKQKLNNGGVKIQLQTAIGDIYLRKK